VRLALPLGGNCFQKDHGRGGRSPIQKKEALQFGRKIVQWKNTGRKQIEHNFRSRKSKRGKRQAACVVTTGGRGVSMVPQAHTHLPYEYEQKTQTKNLKSREVNQAGRNSPYKKSWGQNNPLKKIKRLSEGRRAEVGKRVDWGK